jgi:chromosome segregation ATPase
MATKSETILKLREEIKRITEEADKQSEALAEIITNKKKDIAALAEKLGECEQENKELRNENKKLQKEADPLIEDLAKCHKNFNQKCNEIDELRKELDKVKDDKSSLEKKLGEVEVEREKLTHEKNDLSNQLLRSDKDKLIGDLEKVISELRSNIDLNEKSAEKEIENLLNQKVDLEEKFNNQVILTEKFEHSTKKHQHEQEKLTAQIDELKDFIKKLQNKNEEDNRDGSDENG